MQSVSTATPGCLLPPRLLFNHARRALSCVGTQAGGVITARELLCPDWVVERDPWATCRVFRAPAGGMVCVIPSLGRGVTLESMNTKSSSPMTDVGLSGPLSLSVIAVTVASWGAVPRPHQELKSVL